MEKFCCKFCDQQLYANQKNIAAYSSYVCRNCLKMGIYIHYQVYDKNELYIILDNYKYKVRYAIRSKACKCSTDIYKYQINIDLTEAKGYAVYDCNLIKRFNDIIDIRPNNFEERIKLIMTFQ